MAVFELDRISKRYNPGLFKKKVLAVSDLSLKVQHGEVFGLIGPNGAGKSTAIRLILGLIRPDSGSVLFRGQPILQSDFRRQIGYLPENPYLYDHLTLNEILLFSGKSSGLGQKQVDHRCDQLLAKVDLLHARKRALRTFSKGMLQRAGICFALLHDPSVVILDEPMSGLDPIGRKMVFDIVRELRDEGKTVFFCSHILSDVERLCDRIGLLANGRLARIFSSDMFRADTKSPIHIVVDPLQTEERCRLRPLVGAFHDESSACVISVAPARLAELLEELTRMNKEVRATRGEKVSLEHLFITTVKEQVA